MFGGLSIALSGLGIDCDLSKDRADDRKEFQMVDRMRWLVLGISIVLLVMGGSATNLGFTADAPPITPNELLVMEEPLDSDGGLLTLDASIPDIREHIAAAAGMKASGSLGFEMTISSAEVRPDTPDADYIFMFNTGAYWLKTRCHMVPVLVPDGATVTGFSVYIQDQSSFNLSINLYRNSLTSASEYEEMATVLTSGSSTDVQVVTDTTIDYAGIDNATYHYYATTCTPNNGDIFVIYGLKIYYTDDSCTMCGVFQ
jgi:hypothetical protein